MSKSLLLQHIQRIAQGVSMACALSVAAMSLTTVQAADVDGMSQRTKDIVAQLKAMETQNGRSLDIYELMFFPGELKDIAMSDRLGNSRTYHYMTFRLRNPGLGEGNDASIAKRYNRYNEVLKNIAQEYEDIIVKNGALSIDVEDPDDEMATILQRDELIPQNRTVRLSIAAYDENGTRMRILDAVPGKGPQEEFNFPDEGGRSVNVGADQVRKRIEEKELKRLLLTSEIAENEMPMYRPGKYDELGNTIGEVSGVIIFDDFSAHGDTFEIQIRGLSNKTRSRIPDHDASELGDYWNMRIYRRTYYISYQRQGDEYFRDRDNFTLINQGWRWRNTFQRVEQRSSMAHVTYFGNNISDAKGKPKNDVIEEIWEYYRKVREQRQDLIDGEAGNGEFEQSLPDLEASVQDSGSE